jgi:hypothetical protein
VEDPVDWITGLDSKRLNFFRVFVLDYQPIGGVGDHF